MRHTINQNRPFRLAYIRTNGSILFDSSTNLEKAKVLAEIRHQKYPKEKVEIYHGRIIVFIIEPKTTLQ